MKRPGLGAAISLGLVLVVAALTVRNLSAGAPGIAPTRPAAELVVTSDRDTGPHTLRDAILAADRSSGRAHILVTAKTIRIESALPALINPRGVQIEASKDAGIVDADRQAKGTVLQISSPGSALKGLHIMHAHDSGILVNASGVQLDSVAVTDSKVGVMFGAAARGCAIRSSTFERNETALIAEKGVRDLTILSGAFRDNTRAALWSVGGAVKPNNSAQDEGSLEPRVRVIDGLFERNATGVVVADQPILIEKSRFIANLGSAVLILGGAARVEESEIRESGDTAISVTAGSHVHLTRNTLSDNAKTAIMARNSEVAIEGNTLTHNGFGIVSIISQGSLSSQIDDNLITRTTGDAITVIGVAPLLRRNQIIDNSGAGLRALDLVQPHSVLKAAPNLDTNVFRGNRPDQPVHGVYKVSGEL